MMMNNTNTTLTNNRNNGKNKAIIIAMSTSIHKHNKPSVVVAKDREVLSFSNRNNNKKRKIGNEDDVNNDDDTTGDNVHCDGIITQRQSQLCWCTFHDFRVSTIHEHPSFVWLGPSSMAVYWYKEYLQPMKQGWIRIPKKEQQKKYSTTIIPSSQHPTAAKGTTIRTPLQRNKVERNQPQQQKQNSKGNFYFIPGQYLRPDPPPGPPPDDGAATTTTDTTTTTTTAPTPTPTPTPTTISTNKNNNNSSRMMIQNILNYGIPDIHYATSYIGVYNLIRSYGRFIKISSKNNNNNNSSNNNGNMNSTSSNKRRRCNKEEEEKQHQNEDEDMHIVVPFDYKGPDLIIPKEQLDDVM